MFQNNAGNCRGRGCGRQRYCAAQLEALCDYAENYGRLELQTGCGHVWDKYNDD